MSKCEIINASDYISLNMEISNFIIDKKVISTSIAIDTFQVGQLNDDRFYACIIYED